MRPVAGARREEPMVGKWWYNLRTKQVEPDDGGPNAERMGPFDTQEEAAAAIELAAKRNEQWDAGDDEWSGKINTDPIGDEWDRAAEEGES